MLLVTASVSAFNSVGVLILLSISYQFFKMPEIPTISISGDYLPTTLYSVISVVSQTMLYGASHSCLGFPLLTMSEGIHLLLLPFGLNILL